MTRTTALLTRPLALLLLAAAAALALAGCGRDKGGAAGAAGASAAANGPAAPGSAPAAVALTVTVTMPQLVEWPQTVAANGSIAAWQEAVIGAEAQGLRLVEVAVHVGQRVRRGDLLARLQSETARAELAATRASLAEAEAALAEARANAERARQLQESGAISAQQIQQYLTGEATARARVNAIRARIEADEVRLAQTRLLAPDDGVISARSATLGAVVQPGQELFRLIRGGRLEWRAEVPADLLTRIAVGMPASVTPAGGRTVAGSVRMVAPTVDPATRNGLVYVDLPQPGDARAGMFARGEFAVGSARALTLPQTAVLPREGFAYVFLLGDDNRVRQVKVGLGRRQGDRIEVTQGLQPGARVVAQGGGFLADGDTVRVVAAPAAAAASAMPAGPAASR